MSPHKILVALCSVMIIGFSFQSGVGAATHSAAKTTVFKIPHGSIFPIRFEAYVIPGNTARARLSIDGQPVITAGPPFTNNAGTTSTLHWDNLDFGKIPKGKHHLVVDFLADPTGDQRLRVDIFPAGTDPNNLGNAVAALTASADAPHGKANVWARALDFWVEVY